MLKKIFHGQIIVRIDPLITFFSIKQFDIGKKNQSMTKKI